jgi:hypothetical protein
MLRKVAPELLDELPPDDPRAIHSRGDLQRINALMGNADIMARMIKGASATHEHPGSDPISVVELGGGDGTFLLRLAGRVAPQIRPVHAILIDRQSLLTAQTRAAFAALSWQVESVEADVFDWLAHRSPEITDVTIANLFLHHFADARLATLLRDGSRRTRMFLACEPYRSRMALAAASMMGLIGCNSVTVHDATISVRAGFRDRELSAVWPQDGHWRLTEHKAGRFTHGFVARRERVETTN